MPQGFLVSATNVPRLLAPVAAGAARAAVPWLWLRFHTVAVLGGVSGGFPTHPAGSARCPPHASRSFPPDSAWHYLRAPFLGGFL